MRLSYRLKYNNAWHEIGSYKADGTIQLGLVNSQNTSIDTSLFTKEGKSVTNSATFRLTWNSSNRDMYIEVMNAFLDAIDSGANIECMIANADDSTTQFSGNVDLSSLTITSGKIPASIDVKAKDYITILDEKVKANLVYEDKAINDVVRSLLVEAGAIYPADLIDSPIPYTKKLQYFVLTEDDDATYRDVIDTLLFEFGYCIYRNPNTGKYAIHKILKTDEPSHQVHYLVSDTLKTTTGLFKYKGAAIIYPNVSTMANTRLFTDDVSVSFDDKGNLVGETIEPGAFYPKDGELKASYQEFDSSYLDREYQEKRSRLQNSHIDLLYVKADTFKLNVNPSEGFDQPAVDLIGKPEGTVLYPRKAWTLLRNNTDKPINLLSFDMTGTAVYKSKLNKLVMPADATNPEEYETSYIFNETDALSFADFFVNWQNLKRTTATWTEIEKVSNVGDVVVIKHKETDIAQAYVVVEQTMKFIDRENVSYHSVGVALSGYKEYSHYEDTYVHKLKPGNVISSTDEFYYSESKTELVNGTWQTTPNGDDSLFLWKRTKTTYSNGKVAYSAPYFAGGQNGESAKMLRIVADSNILRFDSSSIPYEGAKASLSLQTSGLSSNTAAWTVDGTSKGTSEALDIYPEDFERDWISSKSPSTARMRCIAQAHNTVLMGGVSGALVYSTDGGDSWTTVPSFTSGAITGLCYNKGRYVAVDSNGKIFSSDNIASGWPSQDEPTYSTGKILNAITTDGSVFVAVGETYPGTTGIICTSTDGLEWQTISTDCPNFYAICYDSKKFHAVGAGGIVWASEDGARWTQTATIGFDCRGISYDGKYIAGGQGGKIAYSNDGKNWYMGTIKRNSPYEVAHIRAIGSAYGVYYAVCYLDNNSNGRGEIWKSHNGRDWEVCFEPNAANTRLWAVSFASGYMIASGDNGNVYRLPLPRSLLVKAESEGYSDTISILVLQDAIGTSGADGANGVGIKSTLIDYQVSDSGSEAPTGAWDDTVPTVPKGKYLWTRTITTYTDDSSYTAYSVSYFAEDGKQGPKGEDLVKEPGIKIEANPTTYTLSSRGVCKKAQEIELKATLTEVDGDGTVTWRIFKGKEENDVLPGNPVTLIIPDGETATYFKIIASSGSYSSSEMTLIGQSDGNPKPQLASKNVINFEERHTVTATNGGEPLIYGDFIVCKVTDAATGSESGVPCIWDGLSWAVLTEDASNYAQVMSETLPIIVNHGLGNSDNPYFKFVKNLSAKLAVFEKTYVGSWIRSNGINEDSFDTTNDVLKDTGFVLDSETGKIYTTNLRANNAYIKGDLDHEAIKTVAGQTSSAISSGSYEVKNRFSFDKYLSNTACYRGASTYQNSFKSATISYKGKSYNSYLIKLWEGSSNVSFMKTYYKSLGQNSGGHVLGGGESGMLVSDIVKDVTDASVSANEAVYLNFHCKGNTTIFTCYINGDKAYEEKVNGVGVFNGWLNPSDRVRIYCQNTNLFNSRNIECEVTVTKFGFPVQPLAKPTQNIGTDDYAIWTVPFNAHVNRASVTFCASIYANRSTETAVIYKNGSPIYTTEGINTGEYKIRHDFDVKGGDEIELVTKTDDSSGYEYYCNANGVQCAFFTTLTDKGIYLQGDQGIEFVRYNSDTTPSGWVTSSDVPSGIPGINTSATVFAGEDYINNVRSNSAFANIIDKEVTLDPSSYINVDGTNTNIDVINIMNNAIQYRTTGMEWRIIQPLASMGLYSQIALSVTPVKALKSIETANIVPINSESNAYNIGTTEKRYKAAYISEHHVNGWRMSVSNGELTFIYEG